ncbi:MAG: hypothetical protein AB7T07_14640 [Steroidobacteraceae bacterium]
MSNPLVYASLQHAVAHIMASMMTNARVGNIHVELKPDAERRAN